MCWKCDFGICHLCIQIFPEAHFSIVMRFNSMRSVNDMCRIACLINFHRVYGFIIIALPFRIREKFLSSRQKKKLKIPSSPFSQDMSENSQTENMTFFDDEDGNLSSAQHPASQRRQQKERKPLNSSIFRADGEWMSLCPELVNQLSN